MADGDAAAAAGYTVAPSSTDADLIANLIARVQDDLANKTGNKNATIPLSKLLGGTAAAARAALELVKTTTSADSEGKIPAYNASGQLAVGAASSSGQAVSKGQMDAAIAGVSSDFNGGTVTGQIYLPNAFAANIGTWVVAYINGDGRISKGASSSRYKKNITRGTDIPDVFAAPFCSYQMRSDPDGIKRYGYIAEDLDAHEGTAQFVAYDDQGRPDSYDMIGLLLAQVADLHARVRALEDGA